MKNAWLWFKSFFEGNNESPSTTRALSWLWVITLCGGIIFCTAFNAFKGNEAKLPAVDTAYIVITGIFLGAKVGQRIWGETPSGTVPTQITPVVIPPKA